MIPYIAHSCPSRGSASIGKVAPPQLTWYSGQLQRK